MPYRGANYSFTIDSSFRPFEMQELLTPYMMYKDAYEKQEQAYNELSDKSDMFRYLSDTLPKESKARQIYEGYANELSKQAEDLSKNGLSMNNRRALMNLKRRYQGEIGRLEAADTALQKERELRRQMNAKDGSMLYAVDNLDIDKFLDGNTPNLYNISGTELHTLGAAAGRAASSRVYSAGDEGSTLDGYYRRWVERNGYSKESMNAFRAKASDIPELQQAAKNILIERGVYDNLRENPQALRRAEQSVLNGIIDGAITQESVKLVRDEGKMSADAREQYALQREQMTKSAAQQGLRWDPATKSWKYDIDIDPNYQRQEAILKKKAELKVDGSTGSGSGSGGGGKGTTRYPVYDKSYYVSGLGSTFIEDGTDTSKEKMAKLRQAATRVNVDIDSSGGKWEVSVGNGNRKHVLGTISKDATGQFIVETLKKFKYSSTDDISNITRTNTSNYDNQNLEALLYDIVDRMKGEGDYGYENYQWYFSPKSASEKIDNGGYLRDVLKRDYPTLYNNKTWLYPDSEDDEDSYKNN